MDSRRIVANGSGFLFLLGCTIACEAALAATITLTPSQDNSLYQNQDRSNGTGDLVVGRTGQDGTAGPATISIRRGLVAFDIAGSLPAGATITDVALTMTDVQGLNGDQPITLHRALADWGEGTSFVAGGKGAPATEGDATWLYRFYEEDDPANSPAWTVAGGDYVSTASALTIVGDDLGAFQTFTWQDPLMVVDVQNWFDVPGSNFGWFLLGNESAGGTAKRFGSSETSTALPGGGFAAPPELMVTYNAVPEPSSIILAALGVLSLMALRVRRATREPRS